MASISSLPIHIFAASFDCSKATSGTEKLICSDDNISKRDEQLASSYKHALESAIDKDAIKKVQVEWLKQQRICKDVDCLTQIYKDRIVVLNGEKTTSEKSKASNQEVKKPFSDRFDFSKLVVFEEESHNPKLCKEFLNYLKHEYKKGECLPPVSSKDGEIKFPLFAPIDVAPFEAQDLARIPFVYPNKEKQFRMETRIKDIYKRNEEIAWVTKFDIDNDGKADDIFYVSLANVGGRLDYDNSKGSVVWDLLSIWKPKDFILQEDEIIPVLLVFQLMITKWISLFKGKEMSV